MTKLLLAEDHQDTAVLVQKMLEFLGYEVSMATNGVEAVAKASTEFPDLIIMDINMPVMDGLQAIIEIRKDPTTKSIPALAATAQAMPRDQERFLASGFNGYLAKPFTISDLKSAIEHIFDKPLDNTHRSGSPAR
jgi:CheY-like chemotaxis protein